MLALLLAATAFHDVAVFDGQKLQPPTMVVIEGDHIVRVGAGPDPAGATVVDGRGKTLLPGLIDAHAHPFLAALKEALLFGVTTELDMLGIPEGAVEAKKRASPDEADLRTAGYAVTAPGGHGTEYGFPAPTLKSASDAQAFVDARIKEGSDFIKIIYDDGKSYGIHFNTLSKETLRAAVAAAHKRGKLAVVHIATFAAAREAIDAGADALVHLFIDRSPDPEFGRFAAKHRVFVVPTLSVLASACGGGAGTALLEDHHLAPYLAPWQRANLAKKFPNPMPAGCGAPAETIKQLRGAGVPVLAGTDAPNPGTAHGVSLHGELERLVAAGLTPAEALAGATSLAAARFHLDDRGVIAPGKRADLLLVEGDPTKDITATRAIVGVWKAGVRLDRKRPPKD
jgi:imidazolonepropionase-like amidohydrolase